MRCAIFYDPSASGRNDGNPLYVCETLKRIRGLKVDHLAPAGDLSIFGKYDFYVWVDWAEDALKYPEFPCPHPSIYWASDTHLGYDYRLWKARQFDVVFVAQKDAVARFQKDGIKDVRWLPHAAEESAYPRNEIINKYDVSFVGNVNSPNRMEFLERMFREFPNFFFGQRRFEEAALKYNQSKINLNISMKDDINMRTFEVLCCGGFLLTDDMGHIGMWDLFPNEPGKECFATFKTGDLDDAVSKAKYYIVHQDERDAIAQRGYEHVHKYHLFGHRVSAMLEAIKPLTKEPDFKVEFNERGKKDTITLNSEGGLNAANKDGEKG